MQLLRVLSTPGREQAFLLRGLVILLDDEMGEIDLSRKGPAVHAP